MIYKLKPILTYNLWGGNKLANIYLNKDEQYGEAWLLTCLKDQNSPISNNKTLKDIFEVDKNIVKKGYQGNFPLLIKLIDANDDLSIQVHPEEKTEFWHILSNNQSHLYMGFKEDTSKDKVNALLHTSKITKALNYVKVSSGDSYLIKPGTIHAIGKGTFLIEIQRSSDTTYRLYDFNRVDKNGNKRELHIDKALDVIDYKKYVFNKGTNEGLLISCPFFKVYRYKVKGAKSLVANDDGFHSLIVLSGSGALTSKTQKIDIKAFDSLFIPASEGEYTVEGDIEFILTTL